MGRPATFSTDDLIQAAMTHFWHHGYHASSIDDLVTATGLNRQAIYKAAGSKEALYLACFEAYQELIVTPAFAGVEDVGGLAAIAAYFETQIRLAETTGLPGPGCLVANAMTETAPHLPAVAAAVARHQARLTAGFSHALRVENPRLGKGDRTRLADFLTLSAHGLWSLSRSASSVRQLRAHAATIIDLVRTRIAP